MMLGSERVKQEITKYPHGIFKIILRDAIAVDKLCGNKNGHNKKWMPNTHY